MITDAPNSSSTMSTTTVSSSTDVTELTTDSKTDLITQAPTTMKNTDDTATTDDVATLVSSSAHAYLNLLSVVLMVMNVVARFLN